MVDFDLFGIAVSWALEKEAGMVQVLQAEGLGGILDWVHVTGKADGSVNLGDRSAASLRRRGDSDGGQE